MPEKIISYDNLTRFKEDLDVVLDDKQDVLVNGENVKTINGATILGAGDVDTNGNIAPAFSASSTYEVGDVVVYQHVLYKCVTAVGTAGAWDSSKWEQITIADELGIVTITVTGVQSDEMAAKIENAKAVFYSNKFYALETDSSSSKRFAIISLSSSKSTNEVITYSKSTKSITPGNFEYNRVAAIGSKYGNVSVDSSLQTTGSSSTTGTLGLTGKLPYLTTAPSADNTSGFITIVVLSAEPATRYNGFLYLITSSYN